jgi:aminopeptidase-like protein
MGRLTRSPSGEYPEYHSSADNLDLMRPAALAESLDACARIINILENNERLRSTNPRCEPQLGKRGLYSKTGGKDVGQREYALLWVLNMADGDHGMLDILERSQLGLEQTYQAIRDLYKSGLLEIGDHGET